MLHCTVSGMELRRIRNFRGLKPSQLARMGGHPGLARLLSEGPPARSARRRHRRSLRRQRAALSPDALLAILVQVHAACAAPCVRPFAAVICTQPFA